MTRRQREVIAGLLEGQSLGAIAELDGRNIASVDGVLRCARRRVGARTTAQLVAYAVVSGIVPFDPATLAGDRA
ncbi:MAG TPA: hypothetical protein VGB70_12880 [Allosphingosinicella sp.]